MLHIRANKKSDTLLSLLSVIPTLGDTRKDMSGRNVQDDFKNQHIRLRMLSVNEVVKDYDAVMRSIDHLQGVFGQKSKWPGKELTI